MRDIAIVSFAQLPSERRADPRDEAEMLEPIINEALGTVDFKPTLLSLLGMQGKAPMQGRDASTLFKSGKAPEGWVDQAKELAK